jgi:hypothetical protein
MTGDEWLLLYRELLAKLRERGMFEVVAEIETAAAALVIREPTKDEQARIKAISTDVSNTAVRSRNPEEAFAVAINVLRTRLVEAPAVANSLAHRLENHAVVFRPSEGSEYLESQLTEFQLTEMTGSKEESERIAHEINYLVSVAASPKSL